MSVPLSPDPIDSDLIPARSSLDLLVTRLRAAGCVFAEDEAHLLFAAARSAGHLAELVDRRTAGHPLEHVVGWVEFCGLRVAVDPGVFVPRRRTEFLARHAIGLARQTRRDPCVVVDLCCGSGAVGAALAAGSARTRSTAIDVPTVELHSVDIDPAAVRCARRNVSGCRGRVHRGDLYDPLPAGLRQRVDVLIANAPYVPTDEIRLLPPEARLHEARVALDGGPDGLDVLRRLIAASPLWLAPGGHLLVETSEQQAPELLETASRHGLAPRLERSEELDATVVVAAAGGR
jgi:release factor glutamine methyltransferase